MAASVSAQCSGLQVKTYLTNSELVLYENSFQWLIITEKEVFKMWKIILIHIVLLVPDDPGTYLSDNW